MDYESLMQQISQKRADLGQRTAEIPDMESRIRADLFGGDKSLGSMRDNEATKIKELFEFDKGLATSYQSAVPGFVDDPASAANYGKQQLQNRAGELADVQKGIANRRDVLGDALEKAMKLANYGLEAKRMEMEGLQDELDNRMKLEEFELKKKDAQKGTQADQESAAYDAMTAEMRRGMTLRQAVTKYRKYFSADDIYFTYNSVNSGKATGKFQAGKGGWGTATETPDQLKLLGITGGETADNPTQWEAKQKVYQEAAAAKAAGKSSEQINKYIQSQGFDPLDTDFMSLNY